MRGWHFRAGRENSNRERCLKCVVLSTHKIKMPNPTQPIHKSKRKNHLGRDYLRKGWARGRGQSGRMTDVFPLFSAILSTHFREQAV